MATLAESLISSTSRPLTLRMRPDLTSKQQRYHGRSYWVVKEPVGLNYFRFHEEEYAILGMLDGQSSLEDIKERFEAEFTPQKITFQDLQQFIGMLHRSGLVISEAMGQGKQLKKRRDEKKKKELLGKFSNVLAIRFRGIDPEWFLAKAYPYVAWFFRPLTMMFCLMLGLTALSLVAVEFETFRARLPTFHEFFGPHNWIYLGATMGAVKILHEFGHAFSCKHFGGECHEIGAMLLVFTPCLYANVSDSWMLPNKYHRAFIGFAGIYVEAILASIATFIWWFSEPGLLNYLSLSVMFICSVSTVLFNGNPLLRFDGYYILMDLLEIPNLRQKSTEVMKRFMLETCLGIEQQENPFLPQERRWMFGMFTIASVLYRWIVVFSIMYFLNKILEPYGLQVLGRAVAVAGLFGLLVQPMWKLGKFFLAPGSMSKVKKPRLIATIAVIAAVIITVLGVPLPFHVNCTFEVSPLGAESVFPGVAGRLIDVAVEPGQVVIKDELLAQLDNIDLRVQDEKLKGELAELEQQRANLNRQRFSDTRVAMQIPAVDAMINTIRKQLADETVKLERLKVRAPVAGTVFPPPVKPRRDSHDGRLPGWSGSPFHAKNRGAVMQEADQFCQIGDAEQFEAVLVIDQSDIDLIRQYTEQKSGFPLVEMKLDAYRWTTSEGQIVKVASAPMEVTPFSLASQGGGELSAKTDANGMLRPISTSYQARVPMGNSDDLLRVGLTGQARIYTGWQPLGRRMYRYLARTFRFDW
ncbi:MAG: biotin/lipoyl-binding protein [Planctomycetota bacterium]|nr:biotin/lipoyl-binding protein [Planctomycetota bacterium]